MAECFLRMDFQLTVLFCHLKVVMTYKDVKELIKSSNFLVPPFPII